MSDKGSDSGLLKSSPLDYFTLVITTTTTIVTPLCSLLKVLQLWPINNLKKQNKEKTKQNKKPSKAILIPPFLAL